MITDHTLSILQLSGLHAKKRLINTASKTVREQGTAIDTSFKSIDILAIRARNVDTCALIIQILRISTIEALIKIRAKASNAFGATEEAKGCCCIDIIGTIHAFETV